MQGTLCPRFHKAIELIGSRWTGALVRLLMGGRARFAELRDAIPDISDRMLSDRLKALEAGWITNRQIEAARIAITRHVKRGGKVWINIFPDKPVTQKPAETRMGSGKGNPEHWVAVVKPGRVMFELSGVAEPVAREAMRLAMHKLPIKTRFIVRREEA